MLHHSHLQWSLHVIIENMHPWKTLKCFLLLSLVWVTGWLAMLFNLHLWTVVFHAPLSHKVPPPTTSPTPAHGLPWETGIEYQIELFTWKMGNQKSGENSSLECSAWEQFLVFIFTFLSIWSSELKTMCWWIWIEFVGMGSQLVITLIYATVTNMVYIVNMVSFDMSCMANVGLIS